MLLASVPNCTDLYSVATHGLSAPVLTSESPTATSVPTGVQVSIKIQARNPNDFPISVDSVDYQVAVLPAGSDAGTQVFAGTQEGLTIDEGATDTVPVSGVVDTSQPIFKTFRTGQTVPFVITGVAHVDSPAGVAVDFAFSATDSFVVPGSLPASR
jgi:hypothetical protein